MEPPLPLWSLPSPYGASPPLMEPPLPSWSLPSTFTALQHALSALEGEGRRTSSRPCEALFAPMRDAGGGVRVRAFDISDVEASERLRLSCFDSDVEASERKRLFYLGLGMAGRRRGRTTIRRGFSCI
jgi:hypothetical protein